MACFLDDRRDLSINADQWTTAAQDERGMAQDGGTRGGTFKAKLIAAEKARTGLQHEGSVPEREGKGQGRNSPKQPC